MWQLPLNRTSLLTPVDRLLCHLGIDWADSLLSNELTSILGVAPAQIYQPLQHRRSSSRLSKRIRKHTILSVDKRVHVLAHKQAQKQQLTQQVEQKAAEASYMDNDNSRTGEESRHSVNLQSESAVLHTDGIVSSMSVDNSPSVIYPPSPVSNVASVPVVPSTVSEAVEEQIRHPANTVLMMASPTGETSYLATYVGPNGTSVDPDGGARRRLLGWPPGWSVHQHTPSKHTEEKHPTSACLGKWRMIFLIHHFCVISFVCLICTIAQRSVPQLCWHRKLSLLLDSL